MDNNDRYLLQKYNEREYGIFDTEKDKGYIQTAIAKKEDVLAYFNIRNEDEIVYDSKKLEISILEEV